MMCRYRQKADGKQTWDSTLLPRWWYCPASKVAASAIKNSDTLMTAGLPRRILYFEDKHTSWLYL
jgi:hypothetical protein